ncbi:MAG: hypothetical protein MKZ57_03175, partial [Candidatus Poseidoniaceae archaeon]|nr:hypothetical protein [Candidatus Poseidoniaceae archaeon]
MFKDNALKEFEQLAEQPATRRANPGDDHVDNDGDGFTDCLDSDCSALSDCQPSTRLNELAFVGDGAVEIFNGGPGPATLNHYALCRDTLCVDITSTDTVLPGAHAVIYF